MRYNPRKLFEDFTKVKALVIGDVMVDTYLFGSVNRISPEAPVPIVDIEKRESRLGGAANVALNIKGLGARVTLCSVIGRDETGMQTEKLLGKNGISSDNLIKSKSRTSTEKTRIFSRNQQMLRYDAETQDDLSADDEQKLMQQITSLFKKISWDVVVLQDYNKGVLTKKIISTTISLCRKNKIPVAVDPKRNNFFEYKGVTLFKPNLREINDALGREVNKKSLSDLKQAASEMRQRLKHDITLITLAEDGIFATNHKDAAIIPAAVRNVADVSGAGDTVLSVAALGIALKQDFQIVGQLANIAGGLACEEVGVNPIDKERFLEEVLSLD